MSQLGLKKDLIEVLLKQKLHTPWILKGAPMHGIEFGQKGHILSSMLASEFVLFVLY